MQECPSQAPIPPAILGEVAWGLSTLMTMDEYIVADTYASVNGLSTSGAYRFRREDCIRPASHHEACGVAFPGSRGPLPRRCPLCRATRAAAAQCRTDRGTHGSIRDACPERSRGEGS
jgi:hypothetical protein